MRPFLSISAPLLTEFCWTPKDLAQSATTTASLKTLKGKPTAIRVSVKMASHLPRQAPYLYPSTGDRRVAALRRVSGSIPARPMADLPEPWAHSGLPPLQRPSTLYPLKCLHLSTTE